MKLQVVVCFILSVIAFGVAYDGDGQPGCKSQMEIDIQLFRNNWDPSSYWKCEAIDEPPSKMRCPSNMGFLDSKKDCVDWEDWTWEKPVEPMSELEDV